ncbi:MULTISPECIES: F0F1 ATP synthase subunit B [unclassified Dehalobacter]|uniref:F0F1 ATP synthase subunit B n=1 Tax=unclassified Dehalobacter TaxID=2635733 RepID=UPI000372E29D|nr:MULTISPECIES: F0F1 ATP synthase subunit B [unclassified Dehalobacter]TCX48747.1 ATP synthase F0 subunit B [Dehalobacter sp. 14DCB1]TCX56205.1 ATP synthase F0 subunit B [Dehalobacter sp. 12DCB1]
MNPFVIGLTNSIASTAAAGPTTNSPLHFDYTYFVQLLSFLLLVWILKKFAWTPIMNMMEKRRQGIENNLAQAEQERKEAERIRLEYQQEMRQTRQQAQEIIEKATKSSEQRAEEIILEARKETEKIKQSALADIERERDRAIADVKAQVADMSVAVAEKIIRQKLDITGQEALIEQFIQEVGDRPC